MPTPVLAFTTTDKALTEHLMALLLLFMANESAPLRAEQAPELTTGKYAESYKSLREAVQAIDHTINQLIVSRLVANNRQVPLLREADIDRVLGEIYKGK